MYNTHNTLWIQMGLNQTDMRVHCNILTKMPKRMPNSVDSSVTTVWTLISNWHQIVQSYGFKQQVQSQLVCMFYATFAGSSNSSYNNTNIHSILCTRWISQEPSIRACVCVCISIYRFSCVWLCVCALIFSISLRRIGLAPYSIPFDNFPRSRIQRFAYGPK